MRDSEQVGSGTAGSGAMGSGASGSGTVCSSTAGSSDGTTHLPATSISQGLASNPVPAGSAAAK